MYYMLEEMKLGKVTLQSGIFKERFDLNRSYLISLKNQGLLQNFYLEAGVILPGLQVLHEPNTEEIHWGWDAPTCQLRGHFLGHWLSAAAYIYATENDYEIKAKMDKILEELLRCQKLNGGQWTGPIPEKYFEKLEKLQNIWSPQYVMHKLLLGLMHCYLYTDSQIAFQILEGLSDWYINWTNEMLIRNPRAIYKGEESGMLEVWVTMYESTGNEKYKTLYERYSEPKIYQDLENGKDALTNCHVNASIPWSHGAAKLYEVTGEKKWNELTETFWDCAVTNRGYYCTGGQGAGEYWVPPFQQGHYLSEKNQEFCTVYNMVRTASYLFKWTKDTKFADYIELNLYNGFLAQQNPVTGMPTYFLPLKAGSTKKWGTPLHDFWCCYGTMVQAQTLYSSLIYYKEKDQIIISQYIPSWLQTEINDTTISIKQGVNMKYYNDVAFFDEKDDSQMSRWSLKFNVTSETAQTFSVLFRVPGWVKGNPVVSIDQEKVESIQIEDGYIQITRKWTENEILLYFPMQLSQHALPDLKNMVAIMEGPIVLAGICHGEKVLDLNSKQLEEIVIPQHEHTYEVFPWKQGCYRTVGQSKNFDLKPLYDVIDEKYTVYFEIK